VSGKANLILANHSPGKTPEWQRKYKGFADCPGIGKLAWQTGLAYSAIDRKLRKSSLFLLTKEPDGLY
jgi:hypothetical protein